ncbi:MAG: DUF2147 domain-containing protein [Mucilaginibacter sp.]
MEVHKANGNLNWSKTMYESDGTTSRKDVKNKNKKLRTRNFKDLIMLYDFTYHDNAWDGGQIYDPQTVRFSNQFIDQLKKLNEWEVV